MLSSVTAIDILMEPDGTMIGRSNAVNARLLGVFPKGYSLNETHRPHLTTVQQFVRTAHLDEIYDAAGRIIATADPKVWKLQAFKYYYFPSGEIGLAGIVVHPTDAWLKLQRELLDALAPFAVSVAGDEAFFTTPAEPEIVPALIDYVRDFATQNAGKSFSPHVSVGVATREYLDKMLAEPFDPFTFGLVGASIYQLGNYGTARKRLKSWDFSGAAHA
jgi:hypothetical protein